MTRRQQPLQQEPSNDSPAHPTPRLWHDVFTPGEWQLLAERLNLSKRELEVVHAVFDGMTCSAMAKRLGISRHTAHTYLWRTYRKLLVRSRSTLILRVFWESRALPGAALE